MKKLLLLILMALSACHAKTNKQIVVISFDAYPMEYDLDFAKENGIHFTYFISAPYYITKYEATNYRIPGQPLNKSFLGWGNWSNYVIKRIALVDRAIREGNEVGGHAVGHFDGSSWDYATWMYELKYFSNVIDTGIKRYGLEKSNYSYYNMKYLRGFRAPELGVNSNTYRALKDSGYWYDASKVSTGAWWWGWDQINCFPLFEMPYWGHGKKILGMDYNFYWEQSRAVPDSNRGNLARYESEVFLTYSNYFDSVYAMSNRHPIFIGHHNNTNWNYNIYWSAMKRTILYMKTKPDVVFMTYKELMR